MSPRILLLLAGAAALAIAFNPDRVDPAIVSSEDSNVPYKYGCKYRVSSVWNDIIFLIDKSGSYGEFAQLYYTMNDIMQAFTVTKIGSINMAQVRFGFTFFGSDLTIPGPFGQTLLNDISKINTLGYYVADDKVSNIDLALQSAQAQFSKSDRPNARKVLVLMTQTLMQNSTVADGLKKKGYIINTYSLRNPAATNISSNIDLLASPSYATNSNENTVADLQAVQARANCFCDPKSDSFTTDNTTGVPTGGCYGIPKSVVQGSYTTDVNLCASTYRGIVALDKSQTKTDFLNREINGTSSYYIGLKWSDDYLVWLWEDGTMPTVSATLKVIPSTRIIQLEFPLEDVIISLSLPLPATPLASVPAQAAITESSPSTRDKKRLLSLTTLSEGDFNLFPNNVIPTATGDNKFVFQEPIKNQWIVTFCRNALKYICEFAPCDSTNYYCSDI